MFSEAKDLFHLYLRPPRNQRLRPREAVGMLLWSALSCIKDIVKNVRSLYTGTRKPPLLKGRKVVYANTFNNYEALKFLLDKYPDSLLVCDGGFVTKLPNATNVKDHLRSYRRLDKYLFLLYLWLHPAFTARHFELIAKGYGFIDSFIRLLRGNEPACIFISNDHYPSSRALTIASRKLNIPCIYIQHASVTTLFPPLRSSYALLYGKYSEDIYRSIPGSQGAIISVGNHRFDSFKDAILNKKSSRRIGIAYNTRDPLPNVLDLCDFLSKTFGKDSIVVRGHPGDKRKFTAAYATSKSVEQSSLDFLTGVDVLIAGNSSILLEAAAMNVKAFQYYFWDVPRHFLDYYGFIKTGVAVECKSKEDLMRQLNSFFEQRVVKVRETTKLYDASVGTAYEFSVEDHIIETIENILSGNP